MSDYGGCQIIHAEDKWLVQLVIINTSRDVEGHLAQTP